MAVAFTNKEASSVNNPDSGQTTGSIAFQNNRLYMVALVNRGATVSGTALSGGGLTWTQLVAGAGRELWYGFASTGASTDVVTVTWTGTSLGLWWIIDEGTGVDTTTQIVQSSAQGSGTATSGTATLAAFGDATNNAAYGFFTHVANETSSPEAGYTALGNFGAALVPDAGLITEYIVGEDLAVTASWTTSSAWHGHAAEVKAAAGGGTTITVTTAGAIAWTGQDVALLTTIVPGLGAVAWSGATDVAISVAIVVLVSTPGAVIWSGQAIGLVVSLAPTPGAIAWAGQAIGLVVSLRPAIGAITWTGRTQGLITTITPTPGAIAWAGRVAALNTLLATQPGAIAWAGQGGIVLSTGVVAVSPAELAAQAAAPDRSEQAFTSESGAQASLGDRGGELVTADSSSQVSGPS